MRGSNEWVKRLRLTYVSFIAMNILFARTHFFDSWYPKGYCMTTETNCCCHAAPPAEDGALHCPVEATIGMIGGKYKTLILWKLISGPMRFSELRRAVPGATPKMLTQQLREMESDGLVHREIFPVIPPKVEYSLTTFGRSIRPVLESMYAWGSRYLESRGLAVNCTMEPLPREEGLSSLVEDK